MKLPSLSTGTTSPSISSSATSDQVSVTLPVTREVVPAMRFHPRLKCPDCQRQMVLVPTAHRFQKFQCREPDHKEKGVVANSGRFSCYGCDINYCGNCVARVFDMSLEDVRDCLVKPKRRKHKKKKKKAKKERRVAPLLPGQVEAVEVIQVEMLEVTIVD